MHTVHAVVNIPVALSTGTVLTDAPQSLYSENIITKPWWCQRGVEGNIGTVVSRDLSVAIQSPPCTPLSTGIMSLVYHVSSITPLCRHPMRAYLCGVVCHAME